MTSLPPKGSPERTMFVKRMLTDTGFFCRHVLGMDTDRDANGNATSEIGKGGVRDWGPHKELTTFLDDDSKKTSVILAPRYSYKSSIVQGFILRKILAHPNIAILLYMHDQEMAMERCQKMRDMLTDNPILQELFPNVKGPRWAQASFTTGLRTDKSIQQPTLTVASPQKSKTGGRFNIILFDDVVSETNYLTETGRKKSIHCMETSLNLRARGTRYIDVGTPYHPGDAHHWAMDAGWDRLTHLDVGCEVVTREDKTLDLEGDPTWPNLSTEFLRTYLRDGMSFPVFMSQFKLQVVSGFNQAFQRHQFQPIAYSQQLHGQMTGYLLCDVAPSGSDKGDFNALIYVGIDDRNRVHVMDVEVGHWKMYEFCDRYLNMLERWSAKMHHRCEVWEDSLSYHSYLQHLNMRGRERNVRVSTTTQKRNQHERSKNERISLLQYRFQANEVFICDTVSRTWSSGTEVRELWEPEGYKDTESEQWLPSGDLVEWFIRFPHHLKKDVPDCLSLVDAKDRVTNSPVCYYVRARSNEVPEHVRRKPASHHKRRRLSTGSATRFYDRYSTR